MAATVDQKLLRATKFPPEFNTKVDMQKVNLQVMKKWIAGKLAEILGTEDDVVTELCFNLIEGSRHPDIKSMQIQLTGFLEKETAPFCKEMWNLFLSAQSSPQGVPQELLEAKKLELIQEKLAAEKAAEETRLRRDQQERRNREIGDIRDRERRDRGFLHIVATVIVMFLKAAAPPIEVDPVRDLSLLIRAALEAALVPAPVLAVMPVIVAADLVDLVALRVAEAPREDRPPDFETVASVRDQEEAGMSTDRVIRDAETPGRHHLADEEAIVAASLDLRHRHVRVHAARNLDVDRKDRSTRHDSVTAKTEETKKTKTPQQEANKLREKLLKEKIMKMRRTSSSNHVDV
ncbi:hypothetical protein E8E14_012417 [Neopestalotiopsis sp. 37M]|nr:hypothetical protein E8E14_012417 [Neopestalotiopsis sp. 37M]